MKWMKSFEAKKVTKKEPKIETLKKSKSNIVLKERGALLALERNNTPVIYKGSVIFYKLIKSKWEESYEIEYPLDDHISP